VVHILTYGAQEGEEYDKGITIHKVDPSVRTPDIVSWAFVLSHRMAKEALKLREEGFELIHAHDWMTVPAATMLKKSLGVPMVFTLHSTEHGRIGGLHSPVSRQIAQLEWYGTYEASEVIAVGRDERDEIRSHYSVPDEKLHWIPNGVDLERFNRIEDVRWRFAADWEKLVLFVGRLCYQKGIEYFVHAMPKILQAHPEAKFVVVGGDEAAMRYYRELAGRLMPSGKSYFTGFLDEKTLVSLYTQADLTVVPSVYEPFGIVAIESMAGQTPVVGSYTGELKYIIIAGWNGLHTFVADSSSIAFQTNKLLSDPELSKWMGRNGRKKVERDYRWDIIAWHTTGIYGKALGLW
jgi:glycosyltransferase involved in cell wall biosynthesis